MEARLRSFLGIFILLGLAWLCCPRDKRSAVSWRCVGLGVALQVVVAAVILLPGWAGPLFRVASDLVDGLLHHGKVGGEMVFGPLMDFGKLQELFGDGSIFAIQSLVPVIVFFASLMAVLYQLGVMQRVVGGIAKLMVRTLGTSGAETLSAVGNVFVGMTEAPLLIRPYLERMTRSELLTMMIGGMCTVAGTVMAIYAGLLSGAMPTIAGHLITASLISAPAGLAIAKLMLPETEEPETRGRVDILADRPYANLMDAVTVGAADGLRLAANVIAMLIAMVALVSLANGIIGWPARAHNQRLVATVVAGDEAAPDPADAAAVNVALVAAGGVPAAWRPLTFERLVGWGFSPLAYCLGVPAAECATVGQLLGQKTILNEFIAYATMAEMLQQPDPPLGERGRVIASYALCGFANLGSVAILIGGIGGLVPTRRRDLAELGLLSLVGGTLAACQTACVVGLLSIV